MFEKREDVSSLFPADHPLGYAMAFGLPAVEYHRTVQRGPALVNVVKW